MMRTRKKLTPAALGVLLALAGTAEAAPAQPASLEALWDLVQAQQKEIEALKARLRTAEERVEATGEVLEQVRQTGVAAQAGPSAPVREAHEAAGGGHQPFHHGASGRTTVGGYGELHYSNLSGEGGAKDKDEIDFHRFILFLNHEFDARTRFASELEVEHAFVADENDGSGDTAPGEVALEYAYIERDVGETLQLRAGMMLVPVGFINETHEPPTFYGVERNPVEKYILPTTWREGGIALSGRLGPAWQYDLMLHSGLDTDAGSDYAVRKGRKGVGKAPAKDPAFTARIKWTGLPGLEIGAAVQRQTDITQGTDANAGAATLWETHAAWQRGRFGLRALYARWDLDGSGPAAVGADEQVGWYVEPSFRFTPKLGAFVRYNLWDNKAGDGGASEKRQWNAGVNYWPHPDVVFKLDYQIQDNEDGKNQDGLNLGVGYMF